MKKLCEISQFGLRAYLLRTNPRLKKIILQKYQSPIAYYKAQFGGSINKIIVKYNSETFEFHEYEDNYWSLSDRDNRDCVMVGINPESREAYISNINADTVRCGNTIMTNQGSHLFKITLKFLRENKERLHVSKILLTDNAAKSCPGQSDRINLATFLTLLTGHTWYGRSGFRPIERNRRKAYRHNHRIMSHTKLNDIDFNKVIRKLTKRRDRQRITVEQYNYFMEKFHQLKDSNPLVKDLLREIFNITRYDFICSVFDEIQPILVQLLGLQFQDVLGQLYELEI